MRHIFEFQTNFMPTFSKIYPHIKIYDRNHLLKIISCKQVAYVLKNLGKQVDKVVLPIEIFKFYFKNTYCYTQEWIKDFSDLSDFQNYQKNFSDREILIFFKNLLITLSKMHNQNISSGDIWYKNILLNENLDYRYIDLERRTEILFLNYKEFPYLEYTNSFEKMKVSDKINLLRMILYAILDGEFSRNRYLEPLQNYEQYNLPKSIEEKWKNLMKCITPPKEDDYFLEELDQLLHNNYQLPYRKK